MHALAHSGPDHVEVKTHVQFVLAGADVPPGLVLACGFRELADGHDLAKGVHRLANYLLVEILYSRPIAEQWVGVLPRRTRVCDFGIDPFLGLAVPADNATTRTDNALLQPEAGG